MRITRRTSHLALTALTASLLAVGAQAATFTVTNTDDAGAGSLREAMEAANSTSGSDEINFDIPGAGPHVIMPASELPVITEAVHIDGGSQAGIVLEGGLTPSPDRSGPTLSRDGFMGLAIQSSGSTVAGLEIRGFQRGISIGNRDGGPLAYAATGNTIQDNRIYENERAGLDLYAAGPDASVSDNTLEGNDLYGNFGGVQFQAVDGATCSVNNLESNQVHENVVSGVSLHSVSFTPNAPTLSGNMISDNDIVDNGSATGDGGLSLAALALGQTSSMTGNTVVGNRIRGNAPHGVWLVAGFNDGGNALTTQNRIEDNTIEANAGWGVKILGSLGGLPPIFEDGAVVGNVIQGNTFAGNGLGGISTNSATAVQRTSWGAIKSRF